MTRPTDCTCNPGDPRPAADQEPLSRALAETMRQLAAQGRGSSTTLEAGAQILEDPERREEFWEQVIEPTVREVAHQIVHPFGGSA